MGSGRDLSLQTIGFISESSKLFETFLQEKQDIRYSLQKLNALQALFTEKEYKFVARVVSSMKRNRTVNTPDAINYMSRYSNNLIALSPLQTIDIEPTASSKDKLFKNYVYDGTKKSA